MSKKKYRSVKEFFDEFMPGYKKKCKHCGMSEDELTMEEQLHKRTKELEEARKW